MTGDGGPRSARGLAGGFAVAMLFVVVAWPALRATSATFDETLYLPAGYAHLTRGEPRLGPDNPWLLKALFALPVLSLRPTVSPEAERAFDAAAREMEAQWIFGDRFLYRDNRPDALLFRARLVSVALAAMLVALVYAWAHELFGIPGAIFAGALAALDPNLLAHGTLATTDAGATLFFFATASFARRAFRVATVRDVALCGAACAATFASKFTATLLVPVLATLALVRIVGSTPWRVGRRTVTRPLQRTAVATAILVFCGATTTASLWAVYGTATPDPATSLPRRLTELRAARVSVELWERGASVPDDAEIRRVAERTPPALAERVIAAASRWRLAPEPYLAGLAIATTKTRSRASYLLGTVNPTGSVAYFPVAFAVKTPLATLVAFALALFFACDARSTLRVRRDTIWLLAPAAIVGVAAITSGFDIGIRHVLPVYPFLWVLTGSVPGETRRLLGTRAAWATACAVVVALGAATVSARPYFLSFFNGLAGGPRGGLRILSDSNLDWGQGLPALRRWTQEHAVERVNLCYFGTADPAAYGVRFVPLPGSYRVDIPGAGVAGYDPRSPELPGWVAIGTTQLQGTYLDPELRDAYRFLRARKPDAVLAGGAMYVYWVDRWPE